MIYVIYMVFFCRNGIVTDSTSKIYNTFSDVEKVLLILSKITVLGIASRIEDIAGAYQLLHFFGILKYFSIIEIYPCGKIVHFRRYVHQKV